VGQGVVACTGAIAVLVLAGSIGLFWAGILSAFAMAIGTALTVSALASLAVGSRELAARIGGSDGVWAGRVQKIAAVGGSALVFVMGVLLCIASIQNASPL
jgi:nickel/cobalt transporter (NicO) family protein